MRKLLIPRNLQRLILVLLIFVSGKINATHIVATDMYYTHVSGLTYKITVILYGDCGPASAGAFGSLPSGSPKVCIYDGATLQPGMPLSLAIEPPSTGLEITPVCPDSLPYTQCINPSYAIPGIKKFVYSAVYTLPHASSVWRFVYNGSNGSGISGRAAAITNITGATVIQLIDTLNNLGVTQNSSPTMTTIPTPFFCLSQPNNYNPGAVDGDGDGLIFSLVPAVDGTTSCSLGSNVTYTGTAWPGQPVSATTPLRCTAGSFIFDPLTGQISFHPNFIQRAVVVYNIREFRGGVFVGSCQREMTFLVRPCSNLPPSGIYSSATAGTITDSTHFEICANAGAFSININPTDPEGQDIFVTASGLPAGSTFATAGDGTPSPVCTFSWNTTGLAPGSYVFYLTFKDDNCPELGTLTRAFTVTILPTPLPVTGTFTVCIGATTTLTCSPPGGTWSSVTPAVATVGGLSGIVSGVSSGTANISYTLANGCASTAVVTVNPPIPSTFSGSTIVCVGSTTTLTHPMTGGIWSISGAAATISPTGDVTGVVPGTAIVSYTGPSGCGGSSAATIVVTVSAPMTVAPITGPSSVCEAATITLANATPGGTWSTPGPSASVSSTGVVTGLSSGTAVISYTVSNVCGPVTATRVITVNPLPLVGIITGPATVCEGDTATLAVTPATGTWSSTTTAVATISPGGLLSGIAPGTTTISYTVTNSCGTIATNRVITVNPLPTVSVISGPSFVCITSVITLTCTPTGGTWSTPGPAVSVSPTGDVSGLTYGTATVSCSVTNMCGTAVATKTITVDTLPVMGAIAGPDSVCEASTIALTATPTGGIWSSTATGIATVSPGGVVTGIASGTAVISYTITNVCGSVASSSVITVNPLPTVSAIVGPSSVCVGLTIILTCSPPGGVWSSAGTASVSATGIVTGVSGGTATISYTVTNSCGSITATKPVTVNLFPDAGTIGGPTEVCVGESITLTDTVGGGTWSGGAPNASVSATGVVTGLLPGTATISYTVVNGCGPATVTYIITVNPTPDPGIISGPTNVCEGDTIMLSASVPGGTWSISGTATISGAGMVIGISPGTASVTYTVTLGPCSDFTTYTITVDPLPHAGPIAGGPMVCTSNTILMTDPVPGGTWSCTSNASIDSATGVLTGLAPGTAIVTYRVTNGCGTDFATTVVTISLTPDAGTLSGPGNMCVGTFITITPSLTGGTWSSSTPAIASVTTGGTVGGLSPGVAIITYTRTLSVCSAYVVKPVIVDPLPAPGAISGEPTVCEHDSITLTASLPGGAWSLSGSSTASLSATGVLTGLSTGIVTISYTISNSCGTASTTKTIIIKPTPVVNVEGPALMCIGYPVTLTPSSSPGAWSSTDITVATVSGLGLVTPLAVGTAIISYIVTNADGCSGTTTHAVSVGNAPEPGNITGPPHACISGDIALHSTTPGGTWSSSNTAVITIDATTGAAHGVGAGTAILTYTSATNTFGCAGKATFQVEILATSPVTIGGEVTDTRCSGSTDGSIAASPGGGTGPWEYLWSNNKTTASIDGLPMGNYHVSVTDKGTGCVGGKDFVVAEPDAIQALPEVKNEACNMGNGSIAVLVKGGAAPYAFKWSNDGTGTEITDLTHGTYEVEVTDANNCRKKMKADVLEGPCDDVEIQTGLTPNGDGANDVWNIKGLQNYPDNVVQLFDKWGDKVFEQKGYDGTWDGRGRNGSFLPDGTYFYVIKLNARNGAGGKNVLTGSMLIKR